MFGSQVLPGLHGQALFIRDLIKLKGPFTESLAPRKLTLCSLAFFYSYLMSRNIWAVARSCSEHI